MFEEPTYIPGITLDAVTPRVRRICRETVETIAPGLDSDGLFAQAWRRFYAHGFVEPLSMLVLYYLTIEGSDASWSESYPAEGGDEHKWVKEVSETMPAIIRRMVSIGNWEFQNPICHGKVVIF